MKQAQASTPTPASVRKPAQRDRLIRFDARRALGLDGGEMGAALAPRLSRDMGSRLGHDFSRVRVHTTRRADESARALNARAYASGSHLAFAAGLYQPETVQGARLLAHELGHVVEQAALPEAQRSEVVQCEDATGGTSTVPPAVHTNVGDTRLTLIPGPGPLELLGQRLPLPGSLRLTNAFGLGRGPTFVADLDPRQLVVHLLGGIDLTSSPVAGTPPEREGDPDRQATLKLVSPTMRLDFRSGRIDGWATLHVPSAYPAHLHPGTDVAIRVESSVLNPLSWSATASYGPLEANATIRLHYDTDRLARAIGSEPAGLGSELTHPGFSARGSLGLKLPGFRVPLSGFELNAPTTVPRKRPLLGAPTSFPSSFMAGGLIVAPPGSLFSVPAPALGFTGATFGERSGLSGTVAAAPTLSPAAISKGDAFSQEFPVYAYAEVSYVRRLSDGFELGVRAIAQVNTAELVRPPRGLPPPQPGAPRQADPIDPRHPTPPQFEPPISPYGGITIFGRFNAL